MSSVQLFIGYAHNSCDAVQVAETFENALNEDGIVEKVDFRVKKGTKGEDFKIFFIHFDRTNRQLEHMLGEIKRNGFVVLTYARQWDKRLGKHVDRYWKVMPYVKKESPDTETKFVPRILSLGEASAAGITAPKTVTETNTVTEATKTKTTNDDKPLPLESAPECWKDVKFGEWDDAQITLPEVPPEKPKMRREVAVQIPDDGIAAIDELFTPKPKAKRSRRRTSPEPENMFAKLTLEETKTE